MKLQRCIACAFIRISTSVIEGRTLYSGSCRCLYIRSERSIVTVDQAYRNQKQKEYCNDRTSVSL
jgi:hypothetical protein